MYGGGTIGCFRRSARAVARQKRDSERGVQGTVGIRRREARCVADVRDASSPQLLVRRDLSWEKSPAAVVYEITGPAVVRLDATDDVPVALRSRSHGVPLSAATVSPFRS
jgi:hypothetical protein